MCQSSQTKTVNKRRNREWRPTQTRKERIYIIRHIPTPRFDGPETKTPPASHPPNKTTEHPPLPLARLSNTDDASGKKSLVVFFFHFTEKEQQCCPQRLNSAEMRRDRQKASTRRSLFCARCFSNQPQTGLHLLRVSLTTAESPGPETFHNAHRFTFPPTIIRTSTTASTPPC